MKKYKTNANHHWGKPAITEVEADRETESSLWIKGRRQLKQSTFNVYHDTFDEAKAFIVNGASGRAASLCRQLDELNTFIALAKELQP